MSRLTAGWFDFEAEPDMTGDGEGDSNKHYITIALDPGESNEEVAVIVHRTCPDENGVEKFPLDGDLANRKRRLAQIIVDALNSDIATIDQIDVEGAERHVDRMVWTS